MEENNLEAWHLFLDMGKLDLCLYLPIAFLIHIRLEKTPQYVLFQTAFCYWVLHLFALFTLC